MKGNRKYFSNKRKYNNELQTYNGYSYDSKLEAKYAGELDYLVKAGEVEKWERQHKLQIEINGKHIANYFIDFKVWFTDGRVEFHEVKGYETPVWRIKWKCCKALYPDNNFILIK